MFAALTLSRPSDPCQDGVPPPGPLPQQPNAGVGKLVRAPALRDCRHAGRLPAACRGHAPGPPQMLMVSLGGLTALFVEEYDAHPRHEGRIRIPPSLRAGRNADSIPAGRSCRQQLAAGLCHTADAGQHHICRRHVAVADARRAAVPLPGGLARTLGRDLDGQAAGTGCRPAARGIGEVPAMFVQVLPPNDKAPARTVVPTGAVSTAVYTAALAGVNA